MSLFRYIQLLNGDLHSLYCVVWISCRLFNNCSSNSLSDLCSCFAVRRRALKAYNRMNRQNNKCLGFYGSKSPFQCFYLTIKKMLLCRDRCSTKCPSKIVSLFSFCLYHRCCCPPPAHQ